MARRCTGDAGVPVASCAAAADSSLLDCPMPALWRASRPEARRPAADEAAEDDGDEGDGCPEEGAEVQPQDRLDTGDGSEREGDAGEQAREAMLALDQPGADQAPEQAADDGPHSMSRRRGVAASVFCTKVSRSVAIVSARLLPCRRGCSRVGAAAPVAAAARRSPRAPAARRHVCVDI